ncbi:MAG TPA: M14 family zinc carboxypeptidase [Thermoleophilaceae bacterium]|nr:M14 family zinc carboxypeptidase [Thermoleophilaceae bacterium]
MRFPTVLLALLALTATATAATPRVLPATEERLSAADTVKRTCAARLLSADARGIARETWRAPMSGFVNVRLSGARNADWDLAVFDAASKRRMGSSQAFGSTELVQTWVTSGQALSIQGCRRSGSRTAALEVQLVDVAPPKKAGTPSLVRVKLGKASDLARLEALGLDVTHNRREGAADIVLNTLADRRLLEKTGLGYTTRIADLAASYDKSRAADMAYARRLSGKANLPSGNRTSYRELADYEAELKQLAEKFPGHVKPVTLPQQTIEGREIGGVEIAGNVRRPEDGRPVYFIVGVHHAREWPAGEVPLEFAHLLAKSYGKDGRITSLLDRVRVVIVPILNKDGFHAAREAGKTYSLRDQCGEFAGYDNCGDLETVEGVPLGGNAAYRRKNCRGLILPVGVPCELQNGVDPNRNYGEGWGGIGASMNPYAQTYRGTGPWSEPETQALHEYTRSRQVTNLITIHNVAALVLRPPGRRADGLAPDEPRMKELGDQMAAATGYTSQYGWQLYDTSGGTEDWNYAAAGTFGYTIEIGPEDGFFHMPYETGVVAEWEGTGPRKGKGMREALMLSLESAGNAKDHSVFEGRAPAGRVLRVRKEFQTLTSPVCAIALDEPAVDQCQAQGDPIAVDDFLESTMIVPASGRFTWHVTPSTRPFVAARRDEVVKVTREEKFGPAEGESLEPAGSRIVADEWGPESEATRTFKVTNADKADELVVDLTADPVGGGETTNVEDYDVYLYYKQANGTLKPIGIARNDVPPGGALIWNLEDGQGARIGPAQPEQLIVESPPVGEYVAKVVNRVGSGSTWELGVRRLNSEQKVVRSGKSEAWTVTCESADGKKVYDKRTVVIERGQRKTLDFGCGAPASKPKPEPPAGPKPKPDTGDKKAERKEKIQKAKAQRARCIDKAQTAKKAKKRKAKVKKCKRNYRRKAERIRARYS